MIIDVASGEVTERSLFAFTVAGVFLHHYAFQILLCLGNFSTFYEHGVSGLSWIEA